MPSRTAWSRSPRTTSTCSRASPIAWDRHTGARLNDLAWFARLAGDRPGAALPERPLRRDARSRSWARPRCQKVIFFEDRMCAPARSRYQLLDRAVYTATPTPRASTRPRWRPVGGGIRSRFLSRRRGAGITSSPPLRRRRMWWIDRSAPSYSSSCVRPQAHRGLGTRRTPRCQPPGPTPPMPTPISWATTLTPPSRPAPCCRRCPPRLPPQVPHRPCSGHTPSTSSIFHLSAEGEQHDEDRPATPPVTSEHQRASGGAWHTATTRPGGVVDEARVVPAECQRHQRAAHHRQQRVHRHQAGDLVDGLRSIT